MVKIPEPPKRARWMVYKIVAQQTWLGEVEAADESEAIQKAAKEFKEPATKLYALRR